MAFVDRRTLRVLTTISLFIGVLAVLYFGRRTFIVFLFAMFFAYLIEPIVDRAQRMFRGSRGVAIAFVYGAMILAFVGLGETVGPKIMTEGQKLSQALPQMVDQVATGKIAVSIGQERGWSYETQRRLQQLLTSHHQDISAGVRSVAARAGELATATGWILLIPILAVFFLKEKSRLADHFERAIGRVGHRRFVSRVMNDLDQMLGTYIRAQLLLAAFAFGAYMLFLLIVGFPYAFAIAPIAAIVELIPLIGLLVTATLVITMAYLTGYNHFFTLLAFLGAWRIVQDYVFTPLLYKHGLEMHPLAVIFAILLGGELGGVLGMFLSIPAVAAIRIVFENWERRSDGEADQRAA